MSAVLPEFEGVLTPHKIIGGEILVENPKGEAPIRMDLYVGPSGRLFAKPVPPVPIDQLGDKEQVKRHQGVDQI